MCARLGANVDCKKLWDDYVEGYDQRMGNSTGEKAEEAASHQELEHDNGVRAVA